jgi:hypothetical protein
MNFLFACENKIYKYFFEYLESLKKYIKHDFLLFSNEKKVIKNVEKYDILIFMHNLPNFILENENLKKKSFVINTEQITKKENFDKIKNFNVNIIDYSYSNILLLEKELKINSIYFPYVINKKEIYNFEKTNGICFMGLLSERRLKILKELKKNGIDVTIIKNMYMGEQDDILFKHKILINIHYYDDYNIYESLRCDRCVFNKMIVITEKSLYDDINIFNKKNKIIIENYNDLVKKIKEIYENYEIYYNKLFCDYENFMEEYEKEQNDIYKNGLEKIKNINQL